MLRQVQGGDGGGDVGDGEAVIELLVLVGKSLGASEKSSQKIQSGFKLNSRIWVR